MDPFRGSESYRITLSETRKRIEIGSPAALRFAWDHIQQWQGGDPAHTPCGVLEDEPAFPRRGFMLDISRCKVPTRESLEEWVRLLSAFRYNELQLYTEHSFAYSRHPAVWKNASPLTADDIRWLQDLCAEHGIELVPHQNCFGHFERWIQQEAYRKFAESPDGFVTPWGDKRSVGSVLKPDSDSFRLVTGLLDEYLPLFKSAWVNIGCDETFELGQGASRSRCEQEGMGAVYASFVRDIMDYAWETHGKRSQFWGDILVKHPGELHRIPKQALALEWGYEADHPFERECACFAESGLDFVICPGTSSWRSFAGRTENMRLNLKRAADAAEQHHAKGLLLTDWGDCGHLQQNPVSYPALAWCGLLAWNPGTATESEAWACCDAVAFVGQHGDTDAWLAAGRVSDQLEVFPGNSTAIFQLFQNPHPADSALGRISVGQLHETLATLDTLPTPRSYHAEWEQTLRNLRLGLARGLEARGVGNTRALTDEAAQAHADLWRQRNREGGLAESLTMYREQPTKPL